MRNEKRKKFFDWLKFFELWLESNNLFNLEKLEDFLMRKFGAKMIKEVSGKNIKFINLFNFYNLTCKIWSKKVKFVKNYHEMFL